MNLMLARKEMEYADVFMWQGRRLFCTFGVGLFPVAGEKDVDGNLYHVADVCDLPLPTTREFAGWSFQEWQEHERAKKRTMDVLTTSSRMVALRANLATMETYLAIRIRERDWHGVMDAAADIREIEAEMRGVERK